MGLALGKTENKLKRKLLLCASVIVNLGLLGFFKYYNFFVENFVTAFSLFGSTINAGTLEIVLPVGISFYTFQTLSYTIDLYKRKLEHSKSKCYKYCWHSKCDRLWQNGCGRNFSWNSSL